MVLCARGRLVWMLFAASACAKGALGGSDGGALTFGSGTTMTATMSSTDPSASATTDSDTDVATDTTDSDATASATDDPTDASDSDASEVGGEMCGNGTIDGAEQCDGAELGGADCMAQGLVGGSLACTAQCTFDVAGCVAAVCGDSTLQEGEICDCGMAGAPCTPAQLGDQACTALPGPGGTNYTGGTLACTPQCGFDESGCTACGDGVIAPGETCDGGDLGGQTCQSQGFDAGSLSCTAQCSLNTGACADYVCGNAVCDPIEDSCTCPGDCPDDPNSCSDCQCGASGGACYCDAFCLDFGDCCFDGPC